MSSNPRHRSVIVIAGPTAVGKTAVAIDLALLYNTSVISADSRQCYREMSIGVARPSEEELTQVPHYFIATHSIADEITAAGYEEYALQQTAELFAANEIVIVAGGTGLYIKAFCEGLDNVPAAPAGIRERIISQYELNGIEWLKEQLRDKDPVFAEKGEMKNPHRMMRALEVIEATGQSVLSFRTGKTVQRDFNIIKIGLELPREELYERINARVGDMMNAGLLDEVKKLFPFRQLNALQTVGYTELFGYLDQHVTLERAVELIRQNTRRYAKRQMTWFKKDAEFTWFHPRQLDEIRSYIASRLV